MDEGVCEGVGVGLLPAIREVIEGAEVVEGIDGCMGVTVGRKAINWVFDHVEVTEEDVHQGMVILNPGGGKAVEEGGIF